MSGAALSRRGFLGGAIAGGALCLGVSLGGTGCNRHQKRMIRRAEKTGEFSPNLYITVLPSGRIALALNKSEIGQGVTTGYATLVAEELEVEVDEVDFYFVDSHDKYRTSAAEGVPLFLLHGTGGSTSTKEAYVPLRRAAAAAREMLVAAAAGEWGVAARACAAEAGRVVHRDSGRSLGYGALTRQAARQSVPERPRIKERSEFRVIGKHDRRVDARAKVLGTARFGIDVEVDGMVKAHVLHPPVYGARATDVRADAARAMPGVVDVFAFRWGVAVVAEKYWQALRAARAVEVTWGEGAVAGLDTEALRRAARSHRGRGVALRDDGDAEAAVKRAGESAIEAVYEAPHLAHAPMEPMNCTVSVNRGKVEVWAPCQVPTAIQEFVADAIDVSADDVLVHTTYCGGGFGRRLVGDYAAQAAVIARRVRRPVQMIWSRESDTRQGFYRPAATVFMRGAAGDDGRAAALSYHSLSQPITQDQIEGLRGGQPTWMPAMWRNIMARSTAALVGTNTVPDMFATEGARDTPYRIANLRAAYTPIDTAMPVAFWRSVGHSFNAFAMESFIDELARAAGADPFAFRRAMLREGSREQRVLDAVAALSAWDEPATDGFAKGIARHTAFHTEVAEVAEVGVVDGRITVRRVWCVVDCGVAINPDLVVAQMEGGILFGISAALDQEITVVDGVVQQGNFDTFPSLRMHECPEILVEVMDSSASPTGVGEPGLPPIAPAIANALFAATGVRLRRMPLQRAWDTREQTR